MTTPDLRETVARAIYDAWNMSGVPYDSPIVKGNIFREGKVHAQADAAIAAAIDWLAEEAGDIETSLATNGGRVSVTLADWLRAQTPEGVMHE